MTREQRDDQAPSPLDLETAYENACGESWDDLLQYLESDPSEDMSDLDREDLQQLTERVRALMDEGAEYPQSAGELSDLLRRAA
jgi:thioester reductase-like protein